MISTSLGSGWIRLHPESLENIPEAKDLFRDPDMSSEQLKSEQQTLGWPPTGVEFVMS